MADRSCRSAVVGESQFALRRIGLRYVSDNVPGIRRIPQGKSFVYRTPTGRILRSRQELERIASLVIPPAWTDVWICPLDNGHLQATGRDARGRKQYRYHPQWNASRNETKFHRMVLFGYLLPKVRRVTDGHLRRSRLTYERVMAAVVRLLEQTAIRIGNAEYATENGSFGLTTIRGKHVRVKGSHIRFQFVGKHGKQNKVEIDDRRLARLVCSCQDLPGYELFKYIDESDVGSTDVNDYIRSICGHEFTAKDFRTWSGTVHAAAEFKAIGEASSRTQVRKNIVEVVKRVAGCLNNRPATCRKYYVHPALIDAYERGTLLRELNRPSVVRPGRNLQGLSPLERSVLRVLEGASHQSSSGGRTRSTAR